MPRNTPFASAHPVKTFIALTLLVALISPLSPTLLAQETKPRLAATWYKGNLHTHSFWSDGNDFPEMIARWYATRDYNFLALTDHNILSEGEKWMARKTLIQRGGEDVIKKYEAAMPADWIETRKEGSEIRLKCLAEFRSQYEKPDNFLMLTGEEISDSVGGKPVHMNATNLEKLIRPSGGKTIREAISANMRVAIEQAKSLDREILVHLNHPNFGWAITAEDLAAVLEEQFFEIYNGHPGVNHAGDEQRAGVEKVWDIANTIRVAKLSAPPMFGLATDDGHHYHGRGGSQPGRGWIMVKADQLDGTEIVKAIKRGDFYCSSGVVIDDILWDKKLGKLEIKIRPEDGVTYSTSFIGTPKDYNSESKPQLDKNGKPTRGTRIYSADVGKIFATVEGTSPSYQMTGNELYLRATITTTKAHPNPSFKNQKTQAWTQPVVWTK